MITIDKAKFNEWRNNHVEKEIKRMIEQLESPLTYYDQDKVALFMRILMSDALVFVREAEREQTHKKEPNNADA